MIPAIIPPTIVTITIFSKKKVLKGHRTMIYMYIGIFKPYTFPQVIVEVIYIGILIPDTLPLVITENVISVMLVELDIGHK